MRLVSEEVKCVCHLPSWKQCLLKSEEMVCNSGWTADLQEWWWAAGNLARGWLPLFYHRGQHEQEQAVCLWEGKPRASWVYIEKNIAREWGEVAPSSSLSPSEATAGVQCPGLGSPVHGRHLSIQEWAQWGVVKVKTEAYGIEGEADRAGTVQPRERKTWGGLFQMNKHPITGKDIKMELDSAICKGPRYGSALLCFCDAVCVDTATWLNSHEKVVIK